MKSEMSKAAMISVQCGFIIANCDPLNFFFFNYCRVINVCHLQWKQAHANECFEGEEENKQQRIDSHHVVNHVIHFSSGYDKKENQIIINAIISVFVLLDT